jgi:nicotinamidase-related amidase
MESKFGGMKMESTALLVVDVQKGFFKKKNWVYKEDSLVENINFLIDKSRERNIPVIFIRHTNKGFLLENSDNWQINPALKAGSDDYYFNKEYSSIFDEKKIVKELKILSIKTFIITGLVTHGCVKAACLGAKSAGYEVILAEDGHSNFNENAKKLIDEWNEKLSNEGIAVIPTRNVFE